MQLKKLMGQLAVALVLVLWMSIGSLGWAQERSDLGKFSNEELLAKAERTFLMRNFTAAEKYYRELNDRLLKQLSSLEPNDAQKQIELEEELVLAPFGLGHSLIYLHRYPEAL